MIRYGINYYSDGPTGHVNVTVQDTDSPMDSYTIGLNSTGTAGTYSVMDESDRYGEALKKGNVISTEWFDAPGEAGTQLWNDTQGSTGTTYSYWLFNADRDPSNGMNCVEWTQYVLRSVQPNIGDAFDSIDRSQMNALVTGALLPYTSPENRGDYGYYGTVCTEIVFT